MLIGRPDDIASSEITSESLYWNRRDWLKAAGIGAAAFLPALPSFRPSVLPSAQELVPNKWEEITGYNNFYEFGTGKEDPAENATAFKTRPWTITVDGEVAKPATFDTNPRRHDSRRNSPSVTTLRPRLSCQRIASTMQSSSAERSSSSRLGLSRLPMCSARKGGVTSARATPRGT